MLKTARVEKLMFIYRSFARPFARRGGRARYVVVATREADQTQKRPAPFVMYAVVRGFASTKSS